jgi:hypothetical protein
LSSRCCSRPPTSRSGLAIHESEGAVTAEGFNDSSRLSAVGTALALVLFAGIFSLWFVGLPRAHVGEAEDTFVATVLLGHPEPAP